MPSKNKTLAIRTTATAFKKVMFFNKFSIEKFDDYLLMTYVFTEIRETPLDFFSCVISKRDLEQEKNSIISYLERMPDIDDKTEGKWVGAPTPRNIFTINTINVSYVDKIAEITLHNFSMKSAIDNVREANSKSKSVEIISEPIALLRSPIGIQKQLLSEIYI